MFEGLLEPTERVLGQADRDIGAAALHQPVDQIGNLVDAPCERRDIAVPEEAVGPCDSGDRLLQLSRALGSGADRAYKSPDSCLGPTRESTAHRSSDL